jgi:hypothetical protein
MAFDAGGASGGGSSWTPPRPGGRPTMPRGGGVRLIPRLGGGYTTPVQSQPSYVERMVSGAAQSFNPLNLWEGIKHPMRGPKTPMNMYYGQEDQDQIFQMMQQSLTTPEGQGALMAGALTGRGISSLVNRVPPNLATRAATYPTGTSNTWRIKNRNMGAHGGFGGRFGNPDDRAIVAQQRAAPSVDEHLKMLDNLAMMKQLSGNQRYSIGKHMPAKSKNFHPDFQADPYRATQAYNHPEGFFFPEQKGKADFFTAEDRWPKSQQMHSYALPEMMHQKLSGPLSKRGIELPSMEAFYGYNQGGWNKGILAQLGRPGFIDESRPFPKRTQMFNLWRKGE